MQTCCLIKRLHSQRHTWLFYPLVAPNFDRKWKFSGVPAAATAIFLSDFDRRVEQSKSLVLDIFRHLFWDLTQVLQHKQVFFSLSLKFWADRLHRGQPQPEIKKTRNKNKQTYKQKNEHNILKLAFYPARKLFFKTREEFSRWIAAVRINRFSGAKCLRNV